MARYDRIAPIRPPGRGKAFPGWLVLRDLEVDERDADLARRARLRFFALRPLRRVLQQDGRVAQTQVARQIEGVREELGHLTPRDPERVQLARLLHAVQDFSAPMVAACCLEVGELAEEAGHHSAAEEFFRTALEVAETFHLEASRAAALRHLGELFRRCSRSDDAASAFATAAEVALGAGDRVEWARAVAASAALAGATGDAEGARTALEEAVRRAGEWGDPVALATTSLALAAADRRGGRPEPALERAWSIVEAFPDSQLRSGALAEVGADLRALGLHDAAERCFALALAESADAAERWRLQVELAVEAAETGDTDGFLGARRRLLKEARVEPPTPRAAAFLHLELGRASLVAGFADAARDHVRDGLAAAHGLGDPELLDDLNDLLTALERAPSGLAAAKSSSASPGERAQRIAAEVGRLQEPAIAHS